MPCARAYDPGPRVTGFGELTGEVVKVHVLDDQQATEAVGVAMEAELLPDVALLLTLPASVPLVAPLSDSGTSPRWVTHDQVLKGPASEECSFRQEQSWGWKWANKGRNNGWRNRSSTRRFGLRHDHKATGLRERLEARRLAYRRRYGHRQCA